LAVKADKGHVPGDGAFVHASSDGKVFTMRNGVGGEPHNMTSIVLQGEQAAVHTKSMPASVAVPGPEGKFVYTGAAVYTTQLELVFPRPEPRSFAKPFLPSHQGAYFMRLDFKDWDKLGGKLSFFLPGLDRPFAELDGVEGVTNEQVSSGELRDKLPHDQRVHFIPAAKLVVSVPGTNDRLVLHRLRPEGALDKSGIDYLIVTTTPPATGKKGDEYRYKVAVKSKKGGLKFRLDSGPKGMAVSPAGEVVWKVPADFAEAATDVILTVSDAG